MTPNVTATRQAPILSGHARVIATPLRFSSPPTVRARAALLAIPITKTTSARTTRRASISHELWYPRRIGRKPTMTGQVASPVPQRLSNTPHVESCPTHRSFADVRQGVPHVLSSLQSVLCTAKQSSRSGLCRTGAK